MDDGKVLDAKIIGTDPKTDLALVKVEGRGNFPFVSFADDKPRSASGLSRWGIPSVLAARSPQASFGARKGYRLRTLQRFPADRCRREPGQFRRPDFQYERTRHWCEHGHLFPLWRLSWHSFRHPGFHSEAGRGAAQGTRLRRTRMDWGTGPAPHEGDCREHRLERSGWCPDHGHSTR